MRLSQAVCVATGRRIHPFGDPVGQVPVLGRELAEVQDGVLDSLGITRVETPRAGEPCLIFSDRTWFTEHAIRRLLAAGPGRLRVDDPGFWTSTGPLQQVPAPGLYELGWHEGDHQGGLDALEPITVDLDLHDLPVPDMGAAVAHAARPVRVGAALVHQVDHWSHIVRVNQLALAAHGEAMRLAWQRAPWWRRLFGGLRLLWRAGRLNEYAVMSALSERGEGARVHPTAVVELSQIGPGVEIGAHAVVHASVIGAGTRIEEHATVVMSSVGERCHVGRYGFVNLCTVYPGAQVSSGGGYQASVFGRDAFVAWGATALDLSFGQPVRVDHPDHPGQRIDSGHHFLGVAVGHGARIGNAVRLLHGVAVPNGALIVAGGDDLLRRWSEASDGPQRVVAGRLEPL